MTSDLRCLLHVNSKSSKKTKKGQAKLCSTAYSKHRCKCSNCKIFALEKQKKYRQKNLEKIRKYQKTYREKNIGKKRVRVIKDLVLYSQKRKEYNDRYRDKDIEKIRELWRDKDRRRRANKKKNGFERYTENQILRLYGTNCYLCNIPIDLNATRLIGKPGWQYGLHIEHVIDIMLGGPDTIDNVRPSHAICNLKKKPREMV